MFNENQTGEQMQLRRSIIKKEYSDYYESVSSILFHHDPIGINFETNTDEYEPEVDTILPRLRDCASSEDALSVIFEEFQQWFGEDGAGEKSKYEGIANEIWNLWKDRKLI